MNLAALQSAVLTWANAQMGCKVIIADSNDPRPAGLYGTARFMDNTKVGEDHIGHPDADSGIANIIGNREFKVYFQAIGAGALQALSDLRDSLEKQEIQDAFAAAGLFYIDSDPILNISGLIDKTSVQRGAFDVKFRTDSVITDALGIIEHADFAGTFKRSRGDESPLIRDFSI